MISERFEVLFKQRSVVIYIVVYWYKLNLDQTELRKCDALNLVQAKAHNTAPKSTFPKAGIQVFFWETRFLRQAQCFLKFLQFESLKCFLNVSYKFWFTQSPKKGCLQCAQLCLLFVFFSKFQVNWTYFPLEVASALWVWFCLFVLM